MMANAHPFNGVYSATYSNVPVYEFSFGGHHVMRRRHDNWVNATQILKVAEYDKPSRTRILEKEVQKDIHEKVQGGYGKYQGTWVPLQMARELAERNKVLHKLLPLFDFVPGDVSPPPAPKHTTNKPKIPKPAGPKKVPKSKPVQAVGKLRPDWNSSMTIQHHHEDSFENSTAASESFLDEEEAYQTLPRQSGTLKRKREVELDNVHQIYGDSLLDYFILVGKDDSPAQGVSPPQVPDGFQVNRPIDNLEHTSLHWAASMGDLDMVKYFINLGADKQARNIRGETPLIRAIIFTNSYAKDIMPRMVHLLQDTFRIYDNFGGTVFHHAAALTLSHVKKKAARYYLNILLSFYSENVSQEDFFRLVNAQDDNGDTALHIVARNNAKRCIRVLQGHGVSGDILNGRNETADQILASYRNVQYEIGSSSPIYPVSSSNNGARSGAAKSSGLPSSSNYETQPVRSFTDSFSTLIPDKTRQIMLALEQGVQEKVEDLAEANRLVRALNAERDQVRQEMMRLLEQTKDSEDDEALVAEEAALLAECESLTEQIQFKTLRQEIRAEESKLSPLALQAHPLTNGDIADDAEFEQKYRAAQRLARNQQERRAAVSAAVKAMATAGMTERGDQYKKVLMNTLGVSADDVMSIVPEMLEMVEMAEMDINAEKLNATQSAVVVLEDE